MRRIDLVQLLIYRYDIAGVAYDASQDVTHCGSSSMWNSVVWGS